MIIIVIIKLTKIIVFWKGFIFFKLFNYNKIISLFIDGYNELNVVDDGL
jgi:hypothetical protein